jgi:hypothetical protein
LAIVFFPERSAHLVAIGFVGVHGLPTDRFLTLLTPDHSPLMLRQEPTLFANKWASIIERCD